MKYYVYLAIQLFLFTNLYATVESSLAKATNYAKNTIWALEENKGQVTGLDSAKVKFFYTKGVTTMFILQSGIAYQQEVIHYPEGYKMFNKHFSSEDITAMEEMRKKIRRETYRMDIELVGANQQAEIIKEGMSSDYIQYYNHNALDVRSYQKITYKNIYPNIDWVIYLSNSSNPLSSDTESSSAGRCEVKYDFVVHPGGNPTDIKLKTHWVEDINIKPDGSMTMVNRMGSITELPPVSFQGKEQISTSFLLDNDEIRFKLSSYDKTKTLIIDPSLAWSTYYGGNKIDYGSDCTTDYSGNIYLVGSSTSAMNIALGGHQLVFGGGGTIWTGDGDAIIVKFNTDGKRLWASYYGGSLSDAGSSCTIDKFNNLYVGGFATSTNNIFYLGQYGDTIGNRFIVKLDSLGIRKWCTYYCSTINSMCTDNSNNIIVGGSRFSIPPLLKPGFMNTHQISPGTSSDGILSKLSSDGVKIWSTYYGGNGYDNINGCAVDRYDNIFICGETESSNNISYLGFKNNYTGGYINNLNNGKRDAFLAKFNSSGVRQWGTYYCDSSYTDNAFACAADSNGNVYLSGKTSDTSGIAINGFQNKKKIVNQNLNEYAAFIVKFDINGNRLWGTYYFNGVELRSLKVDQNNDLIAAGISGSDTIGLNYNRFQMFNFPLSAETLCVKFNSTGTRIWSSTVLGGNGAEYCLAHSIDKKGNIFMVGFTDSISPIWVSRNLGYKGFQNTFGGDYQDAILVKICNQVDTAQLSIVSDKGSNICVNSLPIKLTAIDTFEGNTPHYSWKKNGIVVGSDTNFYIPSSVSNNDTLECRLISSATCIYKDTVWSNKIVMKIKQADTTVLNTSTCSNQPILFNGNYLLTSGLYRDTLVSSSGCDSFIFLNLTVNLISQTTLPITTLCSSPSYFFKGQNRTLSGIYKDTLKNTNNCDSFIDLILTVISPSSYTFSITLCPGQSYFFNGQNRMTAGTYTQTLTNSVGCDSIITLTLSYLTTPTGVNNIIWACNPYMFKGKTYTSNAIVIDTLKSSFGCDSLYRFNYINLKSKPDTLISNNLNVCDSVTYKNIVHKASFSYTDTTRTTQNVVCDSLYQTTNYTIKYTPAITLSTKQEDTFFKGETITISANNIKNYLWNTGVTKRDISIKLTQNESFYLIAWNDTECRDTAYSNITALDATILEFPTGFNPLSKYPENRTFRPNIIGKVERIQVEIFNRLGEKVYSSNNLVTLGWDGTYKGEAVPQGVYSYLVEYVTNKRIFFKSGEVQLVR